MNVKHFKENVELMTRSGFKLTDLESSLIENSLIILQSANKFRDVFFMGRIETGGSDRYYIAFGYSKDALKDRKFFYSLNGYEWFMMPDVKTELLPVALKATTCFQGDPAHVEKVSMNPTFISDDNEVFITCPAKPKKLKEEDRLSCIVHQIMHESAIVPRGVLYQVNRCVIYNPYFQGLSRLNASQIVNFQLYRSPVNDRNFNIAKREDYNYLTDSYDTIDDLLPKSFTVNIDDRDVCMIRSLKWPGMVFVHKLDTLYQGFFYFGNARENLDMLFMM